MRIVLIAVVGLAVLSGLGYWFLQWKSGADAAEALRVEIQKTKQEGFWVENANDLIVPNITHRENAAVVYRKAFAKYKPVEMKIPLLWSKATDSEIREYTKQFEAALKELNDIRKYTYCSFDHDYDNVALAYPELAALKKFVRALSLRALIQPTISEAAKDLTLAAKISEDSGTGPSGIPSLVRAACDKIVIQSLEQLLTKFPRDASYLEAVLQSLGPPIDPITPYKADLTFIRKALGKPTDARQLIQNWQNFDENLKRLVTQSNNKAVRDRWQAQAIKHYRLFMESAAKDSRLSSLIKSENQLELLGDRALNEVVFGSTYSDVFAVYCRDVSYRRMALQAIRKVEKSDLSMNLPVPGPEGEDPLEDKPLQIKPIPGGFRIFAAGPEGVSLGGTPNDDNPSKGDLVFDYPYRRRQEASHIPAGPGLNQTKVHW